MDIDVKSQNNGDPDVGPTKYKVSVTFNPKAKGKGIGKGRSAKNRFGKFSVRCECQDFVSRGCVCKHIGCLIMKHFH